MVAEIRLIGASCWIKCWIYGKLITFLGNKLNDHLYLCNVTLVQLAGG
jgi:hypothetical protein